MTLELPKYLQMETSTICDQHCSFCPHDKMIKRPKASDSLITKVINELVPGATECYPFLMQDPLLEPRLPEILAEIKRCNWRCQTGIYTTLHNMTKEGIYRLVDERNLDWIVVSNPTNKAALGYDQTVAWNNLDDLLRYRRTRCLTKPKITMDIIEGVRTFDEINKFWGGIVDGIRIVPFDTFHGKIKNNKSAHPSPLPATITAPCSRIWNTFNVHSNGNVVPCCLDYDEEMVMGNMNEQTAQEIWDGPKFSRMRELHSTGRRGEIELCKECKVI